MIVFSDQILLAFSLYDLRCIILASRKQIIAFKNGTFAPPAPPSERQEGRLSGVPEYWNTKIMTSGYETFSTRCWSWFLIKKHAISHLDHALYFFVNDRERDYLVYGCVECVLCHVTLQLPCIQLNELCLLLPSRFIR